jgi:hypothetical protein
VNPQWDFYPTRYSVLRFSARASPKVSQKKLRDLARNGAVSHTVHLDPAEVRNQWTSRVIILGHVDEFSRDAVFGIPELNQT